MTRWGFLATGEMAANMAEAIDVSKNAELYAVASRTMQNAESFAERYGVKKAYAPYEALLADENVDLVYIATPHSNHAELVQAALHAGKPVLCEKAFAMNAAQVESCMALAKEKNLFLMEALWSRFFPLVREMLKRIHRGDIGEITMMEGRFHCERFVEEDHRILSKELGGGALLDIGIYLLAMGQAVLGAPVKATGIADFGPTGVDIFDLVQLNFEKARASYSFSFTAKAPREFVISGTKGCIRIHDIFFKPSQMTVAINGQGEELVEHPYTGSGYAFMVEGVSEAVANGHLEHNYMPMSDTLAIARVMDELRSQWGLVYDADRP